MSSLPGIGKKTALRLVLHLLNQDADKVAAFSNSFRQMRNGVLHCKQCHNVTEQEVCEICSNPERDASTLCVVEDIRALMAIEATWQFKGHYHVLGGIISPMDGVGPDDLNIDQLIKKAENGTTKEIILALSTTMEGDTTNFYIFRKLQDFPVHVSTIAKGISVGNELEYADEVTLGRSILNRLPYENSLVK